ncbi:hypothetical protein D3C81_913000 [compost metagenome]|uniref:Uncharacterized protein n=1 Tax=Pseudomonas wadenswilerensis TaxID=1785161 RepID=A0A380T629_9PSED|nr:hypothetical protein [Pseudomonas wadenswilerensis]SUQ64968.1 hypothetical protein CCOS864_04438 [Pseudomonas wadenswilerensis]
MRKTVEVAVHWTDEHLGGKAVLPDKTPYYVTTDLLKNESGIETNWSLVLEIERNTEDVGSRTGLGKAYFLVESAPSSLLRKGHSLSVYEGGRYVAVVEVVEVVDVV